MSGPGAPKEEQPNYHYRDDRRLREATCQCCQKVYWVFTYGGKTPTIEKCCRCHKGKGYRETHITSKMLSRI